MSNITAVQTVAKTGLEPETVPTLRRTDFHRTSNFGRTLTRIRPGPSTVKVVRPRGGTEKSMAALSYFTAATSTQPFPTKEETLLVGKGVPLESYPPVDPVTVNVRKAELQGIWAKRLQRSITCAPGNVLANGVDKRVRTKDVDGATLAEAPGYYPSTAGLWIDRRVDVSIPRKQKVDHILTRPVGLLALAKGFDFDGNILWPRGVIASVPYYDPEWNWTPSQYQKMAVLAEQTSTFIVKLKKKADKIKDEGDEEAVAKAKAMMRCIRKYARQKKLLEFIRATFDALMLSYQLIVEKMGPDRKRLTSTQSRAVRRFRRQLIIAPFHTASALKALAGECRAWYFENGPKPTHGLVSGFTREEARLFSLMGRALPAVSSDPNDGQMEGLFDRLTSEPIETPADWDEFVALYLAEFAPKKDEETGAPKINWSMLPSNHSSLGYTRAGGGFNEAVKDLTIIGFSRHFQDEVPIPDLPPAERPFLDAHRGKHQEGADFVRRADLDRTVAAAKPVQGFQIRAELSEVMSQALHLGVTYVLDQFDMIPTLPISAPERGLKTRFPTLELAAANCLHQLFRRAADAHFQRDNRCSADMGGTKPPPEFAAKDGPFYSVDASFATDKHMFPLTQALYKRLVKIYPDQLGKYEKYIPLIMGPRRLLTVSVDQIPGAPRPPKLEKLGRKGAKGKPLFGYPTWLRQAEEGVWKTSPQVRIGIRSYREKFDEWLEELKALPHQVTKTGAMMGSATSFPVMPLITFYGVWVAGGKPDSLRIYSQSCKATGDDAEIPCGRGRVSSSIWEQMRQDGTAYHPDAVDIAAEHKSRVFQDAIVRCGVTISKGDPEKNKPRKDYYHSTKSIFKEVFYDGGVRKDSTPTSLWVAPPGGSKAQVNWFTQGTAVKQSLDENGRSYKTRLWDSSPLRREIEAAFRLGVPVREQVAFGGVNYNGFPHRAPGQTDEWLFKINNFTLKEAITGTGLSPLPAPDPSRVRSAATAWFNELVEEKVRIQKMQYNPDFGVDRPHIKDVIEAVAASSANANLFWAPTVKRLDRPSIARTAFTLARTIRPKTDAYRRFANPDKYAGYANVRTGWEGKKDRYFDGTFEDLGMIIPPRPYSLLSMPPSRRLMQVVRPHGDLIVQLAEDPF